MKFLGILLVIAGWLIPVTGLVFTQSTAARFIVTVIGIAVTLLGILGVLNRAHLKNAIWKA
jgi:uncharacterized membrane protein